MAHAEIVVSTRFMLFATTRAVSVVEPIQLCEDDDPCLASKSDRMALPVILKPTNEDL